MPISAVDRLVFMEMAVDKGAQVIVAATRAVRKRKEAQEAWRMQNPAAAEFAELFRIKDFTHLGIGGLDAELSYITRLLQTRRLPREIIEQNDAKHVRGILLYGPSGTGKSLIARHIGDLAHTNTKIINGAKIMRQWFAGSDKKLRKVFSKAQKEQRRREGNSRLHVLVFDEIDVLCRSGGPKDLNFGMLYHIFATMDTMEEPLNNLLIVATLNKVDLIDDALLCPGRFEVRKKISLPDEPGRLQILEIHTAAMRSNDIFDTDVSLEKIAKKTDKFSGADLAGLVGEVQRTCMEKLLEPNRKINMNDFKNVLKNYPRSGHLKPPI
ncbi:hypothetical protein PMAYCL1PPCAC_04667, partial [Pristionchus mayeri]